jgi:hypothetical protein
LGPRSQLQPLTSHRREHGNKVIGEVTLDQVYGGARGIKSLVWEVCDGTSTACHGPLAYNC